MLERSSYFDTPRLAAWLLVGAALIMCGFLVDGITEPGHHAMLIAGGFVIGWKVRRHA